MKTWEYHVSAAPDLATLGAEGWELVAVRDNGEHVFKRAASSVSQRFTQEQTARALAGNSPLCEIPSILNPGLAALARQIGHTQMLLICDRGFPVPHGLPLGVIDLSVTSGVPTVPQVLEALLPELPHDRVIAAKEMQACSIDRWNWHQQQRCPLEPYAHAVFKALASEAIACVRTGDSVPYANVIVVGG